ncbi:lysM domain-containing protein [Ditylenchus destructor]|uniref:LysM domain-containing protein n=1 Tax=Ditylenchus destructor TaxID=166010 RepID=A0AAD4QXT5_9BILA|nr:lysM domain-containing protein [Ditylenchus destructor]
MHSASSSFEENFNPENIELRSRSKAAHTSSNGWRRDDESSNSNGNYSSNRYSVDHIVKPGETINNIALQYSVQVSEIKRVNNLVSDQDVFAFVGKSIRIPVSTFSAQYSQPSSSSVPISGSQLANAFSTIDTSARQNWSGHKLKVNRGHKGRSNLTGDYGEVPLLDDCDNDGEDADGHSIAAETKEAIEGLLEKADATVAAVRENLPSSPALEGGAFHFIEAAAPDNAQKGIWLLIIGVLFIFVVVPLFLTLVEEKSEIEEAAHKAAASSSHSHQHSG